MISIDTNLLFFAYNEDSPFHGGALEFLESVERAADVWLSEFALIEFYRLLRNPAVVDHPLGPAEAAAVIADYRRHPKWRVAGFPEMDSRKFHEELWRLAGKTGFAYRRIYDARLALSLRHHGVTDFATANVKDFEGFGFQRVWNPLG